MSTRYYTTAERDVDTARRVMKLLVLVVVTYFVRVLSRILDCQSRLVDGINHEGDAEGASMLHHQPPSRSFQFPRSLKYWYICCIRHSRSYEYTTC